MNRLNRVVVGVVSLSLGVLSLAAPASAAAPSNDLISNATGVSALPYTDSSSTVEATHTSDEPGDCMTSPTIWYQYTPSSNVYVQADTIGSSFDTKLAAYTLSRKGVLTSAGCDDDSAGYPFSLLRMQLRARTTYYFMLGGYDTAIGSSVFHLSTGTKPEVALDVTGTVDAQGVASVTVTVVCGEGTTGALEYVDLLQAKRSETAEGDASMDWQCGDVGTTLISSYTGIAFQTGRATIYGYGMFGSADLSPALMDLPVQAFRLASER